MKTSLLTIFLSLFFLFGAFSQKEQNDDSFIVSGKVINPETMEGVSFANVNLHETYWGIVCDSAGFFRLRVHPDQKLKISALGFNEQIVSILPPQTKGEGEIFQEIFMEKGSILLDEVSIYSLGTWAQFKEKFVKEDLPEEENITATFDFGNLKLTQAEANSLNRQGFGLNLADGIGLIKSIGQKRKARKGIVTLTDWQLRILQQKYNKEVIAELTHESGFRLEQVMEYINAKQNFTHQTSELYIGVRIKQLYNDFLQEKPQFENNLSFTDSTRSITNHLRP